MTKKVKKHKLPAKTSFLAALPEMARHYWTSPLMVPAEPATWRYLWWILAAAFVARAGVALSGDFVVHPDEIMQYLEPAHGLVFDNKVSYWEYFYGARSWLLPTLIAAILWFCQLIGLDSPTVYIAAVKLLFCAISLLIPYGMYVSGRYLLGERSGRIALLLGSFWYELVGFAHKPMTEFVATSLLFAVIIFVLHPARPTYRRSCIAACIGVLLVAIRFQYAPLVAGILLFDFLRADKRVRGAVIVLSLVIITLVGLFDYVTWGNFLHSYWVNLQVNLYLNTGRAAESSGWYFIGWLSLASGGSFLLAMVATGLNFQRRRFWFFLLLLLILPHMLQAHREYRFIFATIPIWLLLFADFLAVGIRPLKKDNAGQHRLIGGLAYACLISLLGILNFIPYQPLIYRAYSNETGIINFIRNQDSMFTVYRQLAADSSVRGIWDTNRPYFNTGGYYYFHQKKPFYDANTWRIGFSIDQVSDYVSHIISPLPIVPEGIVPLTGGRGAVKAGNIHFPLPVLINDDTLKKLVYWNERGQPTAIDGFVADATIGRFTIWKSIQADKPVRTWEAYQVLPDSAAMYPIVSEAMGDYNILKPVDNAGIRFTP